MNGVSRRGRDEDVGVAADLLGPGGARHVEAVRGAHLPAVGLQARTIDAPGDEARNRRTSRRQAT